jgi:two-component system, LytTR family, sensor kinase
MSFDPALIGARARIVVPAWAGASLFFTAVLMLSDLGGRKSLGYVLYGNALHFALWACLLPILWRSAKALPITSGRRIWNGFVLLLIVALLAGAVAVCHWAIVYSTYFPYRSLYPSMRALLESELIRFVPFDTLIGIVIVVAFSGWQAWQALQQERARANDLEAQLVTARLEALRMQLQPHFLFNTLHTVAGLTVEEPVTARRMVIALGDLLRSTLESGGDRLRTLAEELEYSDLYLGIEKLRLGDRLAIQYDIDPAAARALVPQFLLQPLFENAIRHGAARLTSCCELRFRAWRKPDSLEIVVRNDGPKPPPGSAAPRFGVGLTNTLNRLRIYYGNGHRFAFLERPEGGAQVEISIPYREDMASTAGLPAGGLPRERSGCGSRSPGGSPHAARATATFSRHTVGLV